MVCEASNCNGQAYKNVLDRNGWCCLEVECAPLGFSQWLWLQAAIKRDGISGRVKESLQVHGKPWSYTASTTRDLFYDLHAGLYATITLKRVGAPEAFG